MTTPQNIALNPKCSASSEAVAHEITRLYLQLIQRSERHLHLYKIVTVQQLAAQDVKQRTLCENFIASLTRAANMFFSDEVLH